ncbi:hypothetical protein KSP40_PGU014733 [Platanthera guangdongensis]|uniref:Uncharacterized protein n=1 Tax=Platanthera guangdongensis TaxID=2320717 RepID=A0ABR2MV72_9ASPA
MNFLSRLQTLFLLTGDWKSIPPHSIHCPLLGLLPCPWLTPSAFWEFVAGMSFFKNLSDSLSTLFSSATSVSSSSLRSAPTSEAVMEVPSVVHERVAHKLKGYFELAKEEIDKGVRAEEWGLVDEAITHYMSAQRVMLEAKAVRLPQSLVSGEWMNGSNGDCGGDWGDAGRDDGEAVASSPLGVYRREERKSAVIGVTAGFAIWGARRFAS